MVSEAVWFMRSAVRLERGDMAQKHRVVLMTDLISEIMDWLSTNPHYIWNCTLQELTHALWEASDGKWIEFHQMSRILSEAESTKMVPASYAGLRKFREWGSEESD